MDYFEYLTDLDLSQNYLTDFPYEIFHLFNLNKINLNNNLINKLPRRLILNNNLKLKEILINHNQLTTFSSEFNLPKKLNLLSIENNKLTKFYLNKKVNKLKKIQLHGNEISKIDFLFTKNQIEYLGISNNQLECIPDCFSKLTSLKQLYLQNNPIKKEFPEFLSNLPITELNLSNISFQSIENSLPNSIFNIKTLEHLILTNCFSFCSQESDSPNDLESNLSKIIQSISKLENLTNLQLNSNQFQEIPCSIFHLNNLKNLNLQNNRLEYFDNLLTNLVQLNHLNISDNKIKILPKKILDIGNLAKTKQFYFINNPLSDTFIINGIYPTVEMLFDHFYSSSHSDPSSILPSTSNHPSSIPTIHIQSFEHPPASPSSTSNHFQSMKLSQHIPVGRANSMSENCNTKRFSKDNYSPTTSSSILPSIGINRSISNSSPIELSKVSPSPAAPSASITTTIANGNGNGNGNGIGNGSSSSSSSASSSGTININHLPIISLYFVGPSNSSKSFIIKSLFPSYLPSKIKPTKGTSILPNIPFAFSNLSCCLRIREFGGSSLYFLFQSFFFLLPSSSFFLLFPFPFFLLSSFSFNPFCSPLLPSSLPLIPFISFLQILSTRVCLSFPTPPL